MRVKFHENIQERRDFCCRVVSFDIHRRIGLDETDFLPFANNLAVFLARCHLFEDVIRRTVQNPRDLCNFSHLQRFLHKIENRSTVHDRRLKIESTSVLRRHVTKLREFPGNRTFVRGYHIPAPCKSRLDMRDCRLARENIQRCHLDQNIIVRLCCDLHGR